MIDVPITAPATAAMPRRPIRPLPVIGAALAVASLLAAMLAGPEGTTIPSVVLGAGALCCLTVALGIRFRRLVKEPEAPLLGLIILAVLIVGLAVVAFGLSFAVVAAFGISAVGAAQAVAGLTRLATIRRATPTPWAALRGVSAHDSARLMSDAIGRGLSGLVLILLATFLNVPAAALGAIAVSATAVARSPGTARTSAAVAGVKVPQINDEVAAHLHDSVLQTLALIQRSAHDPAKIVQLARQQEHSLRDWLAGRDGMGARQTVASSLRAVAMEVEQETSGATIDVVTVGTTALDRRTEMLIQAAREAIRNAARHGSPKVRVFAETDPSGTRIFVRDTGAGFSMDHVSADRRGIRDAIIGRMDHVDGTVSIDSGDHGTEIELHLPARPT